jgi:hypothetical protein
VPAPTTSLDTATWTNSYTSDRYLYSIQYPPGWEVEPASRDWTFTADAKTWVSPAADRFIDRQAAYVIGIQTWSVEVRSGIADQWIDGYIPQAAGGNTKCVILAADMPAIIVDGHAGKLADQAACEDAIAFVQFDGRMHVFTVGRAGQLPLFEAFLSTVRFTPAGSAQ